MLEKLCKQRLFKSVPDVGTTGGLDYNPTGCKEPFSVWFLVVLLSFFLNKSPSASAVGVQRSRNVLWSTKPQKTFHRHEGDKIRLNCTFWGELFL